MILFGLFAVLQITSSLYLGGAGTVFMCCEYKSRTDIYMVKYTQL